MSQTPSSMIEDDNKKMMKKNKIENMLQNDSDYFNQMLLKFYKLDVEPCKSKANRNCSNNSRCIKGLGQAQWLIKQEEDVQNEDINLAEEQQFCYRGLKNLGATCYINTFLQLWFHNINLRQTIYKWRPNESNNGNDFLSNPITCLQLVLAMMQYSVRRFVDPTPFIKCLHLDASQEQDTHEFSSLFNSYIQNKLNYENDKSIQRTINQQYSMKIAYIIKCDSCKFISEHETDFNELLLRVKGFKDIEECIGDYLKEEILDDTNRYACQICNRLQTARRFIELRKLPPVLNLQLLRFESSNGRSKKISSFIKFPKRLDMNKFMKKNADSNSSNIYHLFAVLIHEGQTAYSGHYITLIKQENLWYKFNDENVEELKDFNLKIDNDDDNGFNHHNNYDSSAFNNNEKGYHKSKNAYMLVYKRDSNDSNDNQSIKNELRHSNLPKYLIDYIEKDNQIYFKEKEDLLHQKCQERLKELTHQRQVRQIYLKMDCNHLSLNQCDIWSNNNEDGSQNKEKQSMDVINKSWLIKFFSATTNEMVPLIDNKTLLCAHNKLNIDSAFKCITSESADIIYSLYKTNLRLKLPESFCIECVNYRILMLQLKQQMDNDQKLIRNICKFKKNTLINENSQYWVGKESIKKWKNMRINLLKKQFNMDHNQHDSDHDNDFNFNEDLLCEHKRLCSDSSKRTLIRNQAWLILRQHFPEAPEFDENSIVCIDCVEIDQNKQMIRNKNHEIALIQRTNLLKLYNGELYRYWSDLIPAITYHMIPTKFYVKWKKFIMHPNSSTLSSDSLISCQSEIICGQHSLFKFPPFIDDYVGYDKVYLILDDNEWKALTDIYHYSVDVSFITRSDCEQASNYELKPGFCSKCFDQYEQEEKRKRFEYDNLPIYVRKIVTESNCHCVINDDDLSPVNIKKLKTNDTNNENEISHNQQQQLINQRKRTLRKRRMTNELEIIVSSSDKLKDVKFKIMQHFKIATYDQILYYDNKQLLSAQNNCTLAELEIEPYHTIVLKVDDRIDENNSLEECNAAANLGPEAGFKGTQLHLL